MKKQLPNSSSLHSQVQQLANQDCGQILGGNLQGLVNYCSVRLSYALAQCGHPIQINSDYTDSKNRKYIIKCLTMEKYLNDYYQQGEKIQSVSQKSGIVFFKDCGYSDASGHFDVVVNGQAADKNLEKQATQIYFWKC